MFLHAASHLRYKRTVITKDEIICLFFLFTFLSSTSRVLHLHFPFKQAEFLSVHRFKVSTYINPFPQVSSPLSCQWAGVHWDSCTDIITKIWAFASITYSTSNTLLLLTWNRTLLLGIWFSPKYVHLCSSVSQEPLFFKPLSSSAMPDKFSPAAVALLFLLLAAYPFQSDAETLGMTSLTSASLITQHFCLIEPVLICRYLWTQQHFLSTYLFGWLLCINRWQACFYAISSWTNVYFIFATQNKETPMLTVCFPLC